MTIKRILSSFLLNSPLRTKVLLSIIFVVLFGGLIILIFGTRLEHQTIFSLAQAKVRHDLQSAWMVYNDTLKDIQEIVQLNALRESVNSALADGDREALSKALSRVQADFSLDVLNVTDRKGTVIFRTANPQTFGDDLSADPFIRKALEGSIVSGTDIVPREKLVREGEALARRAYLDIVPTPMAAPSADNFEDSGMMLLAAAPLADGEGRIQGAILGGILLNRNYIIVDSVKEIVFKGEKYNGVDIGTATIFQNDLRISTNVQTEDGRRAIGTRVSAEVSQAVIKEGKPWMDRAFVVNDWYISAYEPIKNLGDKIIGILYVGMLEKPYLDLRNRVMVKFTAMAVVFAIVLLSILFIIISSMVQPLKSLVIATNKIAEGDLSHKVDIGQEDEIGQLARSFNQMTDNLKIANKKLVDWGKTLEKRVAERSRKLQEVQASLIQSEKLASLGKMAAGVAHEINNPLTSILINTHLMLEKVNSENPFHEPLSMVADETSRCSSIVKGLLEFSRQNPPQIEPADINDILTRTLKLLENQVVFHNIKIHKDLDKGLPMAMVDKSKMKQVFWNLLVNAAEAMREGGGILTITTRSKPPEKVEIVFQDTGAGIPPENLNKLFDPFFTTKGGGTGLGLAVSYGIIRQHKGKIHVQSTPQQGTTITICLPLTHSEA
jgi:two-component system NtrC family sensor kinase